MDFTLTLPQIFPDGTTVGSYLEESLPGTTVDGPPLGTPISVAAVADGEVTLGGLTSGRRYRAGGLVGGVWHYVGFTPGADYSALPDPVQAAVDLKLDITDFDTFRARLWINIRDEEFGAVGNGTHDDTVAIQAALDACAPGGIVYAPAGTYKTSAELTVPARVQLMGTGKATIIDASAQTGVFTALSAAGALAAPNALTANATEATYTATIASTAAYSVGDWVKLSSSQAYGDTGQPRGEYNRVVSKTPTVLTFEHPLSDTYVAASGGQVQRATPIRGITIRDLQIYGPADSTGEFTGILLEVCQDVEIASVWCNRTPYVGIELNDVWNWRVTDCDFTDITKAGLAYGLVLSYATQDGIVSGCTARNLRHAVTIAGGSGEAGITRRITISGNSFRSIDAAIDSHASCEDIAVVGNTVIVSSDESAVGPTNHDGINMEGTRVTITANTVRGGTGCDAGIRYNGLVTESLSAVIADNMVYGPFERGISIDAEAAYASDGGLVISGNHVEGADLGIYVNGTTETILRITISANTVRNTTNHAIYCFTISYVSVVGNVVDAPSGKVGIYLQVGGKATVSGNTVVGLTGADSLILVRSYTAASVSGNVLDVPTNANGIYFLSSAHGTISGNAIRGATTTGNVGIRLNTTGGVPSTNAAITGNDVSNLAWGVLLDNSATDCTVMANVVKGCTTPLDMGSGTGHISTTADAAGAYNRT